MSKNIELDNNSYISVRKYVIIPCENDNPRWHKKMIDELVELIDERINTLKDKIKSKKYIIAKNKDDEEKCDKLRELIKKHEEDIINNENHLAEVKEADKDYCFTGKEIIDCETRMVKKSMASEANRKNIFFTNCYCELMKIGAVFMPKKELDEKLKDIMNYGLRKEGADSLFGATSIPNPLGGYGFQYSQEVKNKMKTLIKDGLLEGRVVLPNYKEDSPFTIGSQYMTFTSDYDTYEELVEHINDSELNLYLGYGSPQGAPTLFKFKFDLGHGKNREELKTTLLKVYSGEYTYCGSKIGIENDKIILYLTLKVPKQECELYEDVTVGVDIGMAIPAYVSINTYGKEYIRKAIGDINDFLTTKTKISNQRRRIQANARKNQGGHGRKKKLKTLDRFKEYEANWTRNYNHYISSEIVKFAVDNHAKYINIENLEGFGKDKNGKSISSKIFVLRNWTYYQLQQYIEYKAARYGIIVRKINPYHTSIRCSCCGYEDSNNRKSQKEFKCIKCGFTMNADRNASLNIARSDDYMDGNKTYTEKKLQHEDWVKHLQELAKAVNE